MKKGFLFFNYGSIGDALMTVTSLYTIHKKEQDSTFYLIIMNNYSLISNLIREHKWLIPIDFRNKRDLFGLLKNSMTIKMNVLFQPTFGSTSFSVVLLAKIISFRNFFNSPIGFEEPHGISQLLFSKRIYFEPQKTMIENLSNLLWEVEPGIHKIQVDFKFDLNIKHLERYSLQPGNYILIHVAASNSIRSLPSDRWISALNKVRESTSMPFVFTSSPNDIEFVRDIVGMVKGVSVLVENNPDLHVTASLIHYSKLYVGVDTGNTHIAAFLNKQSVVVGNKSNPSWLPYYNSNAVVLTNDENCTCNSMKGGNCFIEYRGKKYYRCMLEISDEIIASSISLRASQ